MWRSDRPELSIRFALEAYGLAQQSNMGVPFAHEAILNSTQGMQRGQPLTGHEATISQIAMTSRMIVALGTDNVVYLWGVTPTRLNSSVTKIQTDDSDVTSMAVSGDDRIPQGSVAKDTSGAC